MGNKLGATPAPRNPETAGPQALEESSDKYAAHELQVSLLVAVHKGPAMKCIQEHTAPSSYATQPALRHHVLRKTGRSGPAPAVALYRSGWQSGVRSL